MFRRSEAVIFFHAGKAFSAAATAASTSCSPARATSSAIRQPSAGLSSVSFLLFLDSTYSLLMKICLGRFLLDHGKDIVKEIGYQNAGDVKEKMN
jgi:hypothetical protein